MTVIGLSRLRAALLVVDVQDRLIRAMPEPVAANLTKQIAILIETATRLGLPIVVSQQYPQGLGRTIAPLETALASAAGAAIHRFDKLEFSAAAAPGFPRLARDQWIVCGMETHVCVYQTARDLAARGAQVHVPTDAVCSRTKASWQIGLSLVERAGAIPTSTEVCVFDLLGRAGTDEFKALSRAIR